MADPDPAARRNALNGVVTQLIAWILGVLGTFVVASSQLADHFAVPGTDAALSKLNGPSLIILGLAGASGFSTLYDYKSAIDGRDTARTPPLLGLKNDTPHE